MSDANEIVNRVANSPLVSLDLETLLDETPRAIYDIKQNLYQGLILKEKEFREAIRDFDWSIYQNQYVGITCSADAIVPMWAYMLLISKIQPIAKAVFLADQEKLEEEILRKSVRERLQIDEFADKKVVIKGCAKITNSELAFVEVSKCLIPVVESLMFGEPCSTVPVFKRRKF
jgi:TATA-box binding protein (TBP) (component of TFIID and TFIIIB)